MSTIIGWKDERTKNNHPKKTGMVCQPLLTLTMVEKNNKTIQQPTKRKTNERIVRCAREMKQIE